MIDTEILLMFTLEIWHCGKKFVAGMYWNLYFFYGCAVIVASASVTVSSRKSGSEGERNSRFVVEGKMERRVFVYDKRTERALEKLSKKPLDRSNAGDTFCRGWRCDGRVHQKEETSDGGVKAYWKPGVSGGNRHEWGKRSGGGEGGVHSGDREWDGGEH